MHKQLHFTLHEKAESGAEREISNDDIFRARVAWRGWRTNEKDFPEFLFPFRPLSVFRPKKKKQKPQAEINNLIRWYISNGRHVRQATAKGELCVAKPDCFL
jgi:hypothetical protein